ncbi:MAG TPA: DUF1499 domain-containing protein [Longimicrobium sp.]|nr:DUF1499 domain-containing protein [Longimicrobium sp.]
MSLWRALTRHEAETSADHADARLRGRAYPVPFARVWDAVLHTAATRRGWTVVATDPRAGTLAAEARTPVWRFVDDIVVRVSLDGDGQTRVDAASTSRRGGGDLGTNARRIARFLHALDRRLSRDAQG